MLKFDIQHYGKLPYGFRKCILERGLDSKWSGFLIQLYHVRDLYFCQNNTRGQLYDWLRGKICFYGIVKIASCNSLYCCADKINCFQDRWKARYPI